jgi:ribosomal protein S26
MVFCNVLNQAIALYSKPNHRKSCKFIQYLNKGKRDEDKSIKRIKIKIKVEFNLIHNFILNANFIRYFIPQHLMYNIFKLFINSLYFINLYGYRNTET